MLYNVCAQISVYSPSSIQNLCKVFLNLTGGSQNWMGNNFVCLIRFVQPMVSSTQLWTARLICMVTETIKGSTFKDVLAKTDFLDTPLSDIVRFVDTLATISHEKIRKTSEMPHILRSGRSGAGCFRSPKHKKIFAQNFQRRTSC